MCTSWTVVASACVLMLGFIGCSPKAREGELPARPSGCDVEVFQAAPSIPTENIGPVSATCGEDISDEDCLRTLKDQACKLGGDVVWGVEDKPSIVHGKKQLTGRAAHTKAAGK